MPIFFVTGKRADPSNEIIRKLKQRRHRRQRDRRKKTIGKNGKTHAFCTFLCRHCTTTTWKCKNSRQRLSLSFPELRYSLLECQYQYLTNWTTWNKRDKVWSLRRRCCLSSLIRIKTPSPECLSCIAGFWNGIPCLRKFVLIS